MTRFSRWREQQRDREYFHPYRRRIRTAIALGLAVYIGLCFGQAFIFGHQEMLPLGQLGLTVLVPLVLYNILLDV